ncbi:MAG: ABC transporter permease subunit [Hyphomicrobiaceae bacterium]|nr:ABC transporter permease subunit [Hyphomicrobiaceae bacterium]
MDWLVIGLVVWLILFPVVVVFLYAFATKWFPSHWWWPQEFGINWFRKILTSNNIVTAMLNSYLIAAVVTLATIGVTFPAAYVFGARTQGNNGSFIQLVEGFSNIPLAFPTITVGIGLLPFYAKIGLLSSFPGVVLAHMIMAVPYALRAMVSSFLMVPPEYEEAARNLGASRALILRKIYLPLVWPGMMAGGIFAFSWSLNEFVLILLLGYPNIETIPVQVYQFVGGYYLHPQQAAALGLFLLVPTLALMFLVERTVKSSAVVPAGA